MAPTYLHENTDIIAKKNKRYFRTFLFFLVGLGTFLIIASLCYEVSAETHEVDDGGSAEFTKIQDAVDAAESGDTIYIHNGDYNESVTIRDLYLTIEGESRSGVKITEPWGNPIFYLRLEDMQDNESGSLHFSNLTISAGQGDGIIIYLTDEDVADYSIIIENCTLMSKDQGDLNKGVDVISNVPSYSFKVRDCSVSNFFRGIGFEVSIDERIEASIVNTLVQDCNLTAISFGGSEGSGEVIIRDCTLTNNSIVKNSATIEMLYFLGDIIITDSNIVGNHHTAIDIQHVGNITVAKTTINSNNGSGIECNDATNLIIENTTISGNYDDDSFPFLGHGIDVDDTDHIKIVDSEISNNYRDAIHLEDWGDESLLFECFNNTIEGNAIGLSFMDYSQSNKDLIITGNRFLNNTNGISIEFVESSISNPKSRIEGNLFKNNSVGIDIQTMANISVESCEFTGNRDGIVLNDVNDLLVTNCKFRDNKNGLNLSVEWDETDFIHIHNNEFHENENGLYLECYQMNTNRDILIQFNNFTENANGIHAYVIDPEVGGYLAHINNNTIEGNVDYGILYTGDNRNTINGTYNWWGDASGPYHPSANSDGSGDNISDNVNFDPWLSEEIHPPEIRNLSGVVQDEDGLPLQEVLIRLTLDDHMYETTTDENGEYVVKGIPAGDADWTLNATQPGYNRSSQTIAIMEDENRLIILNSLETVYVVKDAPDGGLGSKKEPFNSIQSAVNYSKAGTTIRIYDGIFYENVTVWKSLTMIGNGSSSSLINGEDAYTVLNVFSDFVNISKLGITATNGNGSGIYVTSDNVMIEHSECFGKEVGIYGVNASNMILRNNTCHSNTYGITFLSCTNGLIVNNTLRDNEMMGMFLHQSDNNEFISNTLGPDNRDGSYISESNGNIFRDNSITGNRERGLQFIESNDSNIRDNVITNNNETGIYIYLSINNSILSNTIMNNKKGIHVWKESQLITIHDNTISGNREYGILADNNDGYLVNGTNNWWGHVSGPFHPSENPGGEGDTITDGVLFDPWKDMRDPTTLYVDDDAAVGGVGTLSEPYRLIQDAIDAAIPGDTIIVLEGTYLERIVIDVSVMVMGTGNGETIINAEGFGDVVRITAENVTMINLGITESGELRYGIYTQSANTTLERVDCTNNGYGVLVLNTRDSLIHNATFVSNAYGVIIVDATEISIQNCTFEDNENYGINMHSSTDTMITNNMIGPGNEYGIFMVSSDDNLISGNIITSNDARGVYLTTCSNNTFTFNEISFNPDYGISGIASNSNAFHNNTILGNGEGMNFAQFSQNNYAHNNTIYGNLDIGINAALNNGSMIDATYNWWGHSTGPFHSTTNPSGKGDNVSDQVIFDPWLNNQSSESLFAELSILCINMSKNTPFKGEEVNITVILINKGPGEVIDCDFELYFDGNIIDTGSTGPLVIWEEGVINVTWTVHGLVGDHSLMVILDPKNDIKETNEKNNEKSMIFTIVDPAIDYAVEVRTLETSISLNDLNVTILTIWIKNIGNNSDNYYVGITGSYEGWNVTIENRIEMTTVVLRPGEEISLDLLIIQIQNSGKDRQSISIVITATSATHPEVQDILIIEGISSGKGSDSSFPLPGPIIIIFGGAGLVVFISSIEFFEPRKFKFFAGLIPLYTRLKPSSIEDSQTRGEIMGYLRINPGAHYNTIKRDLGYGNNQMTYHLEVLESHNRIKSKTDGRLKRFYPKKYKVPELEGIFKRIVDVLSEIPNLSRDQVAKVVDISPKTASKHLTRLVEDGKLNYHMSGNSKLYGVVSGVKTEGKSPLTEKWESSLTSSR